MKNNRRRLQLRRLFLGCLALGLSVFGFTSCRRRGFPEYPADYREFAYVTNGGSNTVTVLDLVNLRQDRVLQVGAAPTGITANPKRNEVYAVNSGSGTVSVIDAAKNRVAATIAVHRKPYFIDHGAALYFHHDWASMPRKIDSPFAEVAQHILLPWATQIESAVKLAQKRLNAENFAEILSWVPDDWLSAAQTGVDAEKIRAAYADFFTRRLSASHIFEEEAMRAHASVV